MMIPFSPQGKARSRPRAPKPFPKEVASPSLPPDQARFRSLCDQLVSEYEVLWRTNVVLREELLRKEVSNSGTKSEFAWPASPASDSGTKSEFAWPASPEGGWPARPEAEWPAPPPSHAHSEEGLAEDHSQKDCLPGMLAPDSELADLRLGEPSEPTTELPSDICSENGRVESKPRLSRSNTLGKVRFTYKSRLTKNVPMDFTASHGSSPSNISRFRRNKAGSTSTDLANSDLSFSEAGRGVNIRSSMKRCMRKVWKFVEHPEGGFAKKMFHHFYNMLIVCSVFSPIIASTDISEVLRFALSTLDSVFTIIFTMELVIKLVCCPDKCLFLLSMYTFLDFLVVLAGWIKYAFSGDKNMILELIATQVPILRLLKITRHSAGWRLLGLAMRKCVEPLMVPLFLMLLMVVFSGSLLFWIDKHFAPGRAVVDDWSGQGQCFEDLFSPAFRSIPHAMWFVLVTLTTVGYGDVYPHSDLGKLLASLQIVAGIGYMAMPLSIIGNNFSQVWEDRHGLLMRDKIWQQIWNRTQFKGAASLLEIKAVFDSFDPDGSGDITFDEFEPLIEFLQLDFSNKDTLILFKAIDIDCSGEINFAEFADFLIPDGDLESHNGHSRILPCVESLRRCMRRG
ncbi:unnamed protein product [Polarella glacialis]|uniref:EF-hand domain-containing protein n=2 Tax=Polarella glacialis TaxID=89957 RepID=A0A813ISM7_POLGL|nr:unnamed protein product [Polarella glacialis]